MRTQAALDHLMPYTREFWADTDGRTAGLQNAWDAMVDEALAEATLKRPAAAGHLPRGKQGIHSEHLGFLLAEMQSLARQHPGAQW